MCAKEIISLQLKHYRQNLSLYITSKRSSMVADAPLLNSFKCIYTIPRLRPSETWASRRTTLNLVDFCSETRSIKSSSHLLVGNKEFNLGFKLVKLNDLSLSLD